MKQIDNVKYKYSNLRDIIIDEIAKKDFPFVILLEEDWWLVCFGIEECYFVGINVSSKFSLYDAEMSLCANILEYGKKVKEFNTWEEPDATSALYMATMKKREE